MPEYTQIRTIATPRLLLRRFEAVDALVVQQLCDNPAVARGTLNLPQPYTLESAEVWIRGHDEAFARGRCEYAVTERETGELCGCMGISCDARHGSGELGYWIGEAYWNRGYATEAARALIDTAFREWQLHRVCARHFGSNPASGRVMQKCGMICEGIQRQCIRKNDRYEDLVCYGLLREEWLGGVK